jgi:hypothetical protein
MKQYRRIIIKYCDDCPYWNYNNTKCNKENKKTLINNITEKYEIPDWCNLQLVTVIECGEAVMSDDKGNITKMK